MDFILQTGRFCIYASVTANDLCHLCFTVISVLWAFG